MNTVLNEMANVNVANENKFDSILAELDDDEKKPVTPNSRTKVSKKPLAKKTPGKVPAKRTAKKKKAEPAEKSPPRPKPDTVDYKYVTRTKVDGTTKIIDDYRYDNGIIYKWNDEYWEEQVEKHLKEEISEWILENHPKEFYARTLNSVYTMFTSSVKEFKKKKTTEIIIPTKMHWLIVNEKDGTIEAVMPRKHEPIKYQVDVLVPALGPYVIPENPIKGTKFEGFLDSSLPDKDTQELLANYSGYSLTSSTKKQKFMMMTGNGANGKGVIIEILTHLHGNPVSITLKEVDKYNDNLPGASLIFATECDKGKFPEAFLKAAVSGDQMEVRGIYGKKQTVRITAKWFLIANEIPHISDFSDAIFRRTMIIEWNKQFLGGSAKEDLAKDIINSEMKNVLHWCLEGLQKMIVDEWKFKEVEACKISLNNWKNNADKLRMFISEYDYIFDDEEATRKEFIKENLFEQFNKWAEKNNFETLNTTAFWMRMSNIFPGLKNYPNLRPNGKRAVYIRKYTPPLPKE